MIEKDRRRWTDEAGICTNLANLSISMMKKFYQLNYVSLLFSGYHEVEPLLTRWALFSDPFLDFVKLARGFFSSGRAEITKENKTGLMR